MDPFEVLARERAAGRTATLVTVVAVDGNPPSRPGAKLVVAGGAVVAGTLGCSEFDAAGRELAAALAEAASLRRRMVFGPAGEQVLDLFAERYDPQPAVVVCGANPIGHALTQFAALLQRRTRLLDRDPVGDLRAHPPGPADAVVLADHDAPYVDEVLRLVLAGAAGFVGLLGSQRHAPEMVRRLRESGVSAEQLGRLHSPCGLDIGSRSAEEIALSITAEILATERGGSGASMGLDWSAQAVG